MPDRKPGHGLFLKAGFAGGAQDGEKGGMDLGRRPIRVAPRMIREEMGALRGRGALLRGGSRIRFPPLWRADEVGGKRRRLDDGGGVRP